MRNGTSKICFIAGAALLLGACSSAKSVIGLEKQAPDEFEVVTRAPLSLPPDYGLRAPTPGAQRPQEKTVRNTAREVLLNRPTAAGQQTAAVPGASRGESALLSRAGATNADGAIRQTIDRESSVLVEAEDNVFERIFWWQKKQKPGLVVDPKKEASRIREARAFGNPVHKGEVPVIKRRERGILEGIF